VDCRTKKIWTGTGKSEKEIGQLHLLDNLFYTTIRAAPSHGFNVIVLSDAHTTGDRPHMKAPTIIEHHNWVWANMAVPGGHTLTVQTVAQVFPA
jgi:hypothetical protein